MYDGSVNSEYKQSVANNDPARTERMNIRRNRDYRFMVRGEEIPAEICSNPGCNQPISGQILRINGSPFHYNGCWPVKNV